VVQLRGDQATIDADGVVTLILNRDAVVDVADEWIGQGRLGWRIVSGQYYTVKWMWMWMWV
ncbi:hypothetical protein E4U53_001854, partial [Claviceps sorghi]